MGHSRSDLADLFRAYGLGSSGVSSDQIKELLNHLGSTKRTWPFLQEAVDSNRHPVSCMKIAAKAGIIIPAKRRYGLNAYNHLLDNIKYYDSISDEVKSLDLYEVYLSIDPIKFLMRYRDSDLIQVGFIPGLDREEALRKFYRDTLEIYGTFTLESNSRSTYSTQAKVIRYRSQYEDIYYAASDLMILFDLSRGILWKTRQGFGDPRPELAFNRLSLHQLRQRILEKFEQWRNRDGFKQTNCPAELQSILTGLENFLITEPRTEISAYIGNPILS